MKKLFTIILLLCALSQAEDKVLGDNKDIKYISRIEMVQNLSPNGCIVKIYYLHIVGKSYNMINFNKPILQDLIGTKQETVYSNESYEVADGQPIWHAKGRSKKTHPFYIIGLYKYTNTAGARSTIRKFTIKKAVYTAYKKEQKK